MSQTEFAMPRLAAGLLIILTIAVSAATTTAVILWPQPSQIASND